MQLWVEELFQALDDGDTEKFGSFLGDDCTFVFGNREPVEGRENIRESVDQFLQGIEETHHHLDEIYQSPGRVVVRGTVTYEQRDAERKNFPFVNVFELDDERITHYQIYVDNHELEMEHPA